MPVCGQDGKTYDNKCEMECANVDKKCEGTCPCPYESEDDSLDKDEISKEINWLTFPFPIIPHTKILLFNQLNILQTTSAEECMIFEHWRVMPIIY